MTFVQHKLRSEIFRCAAKSEGAFVQCTTAVVRHVFGETKVDHLEVAGAVNREVLGLQVTISDRHLCCPLAAPASWDATSSTDKERDRLRVPAVQFGATLSHGFELSQLSRPEKGGDSERGNCWETVRYLLAEGHVSTPYLVEGALVLAVKFDVLEFMQWLVTCYVTGNEEEDVNDSRAGEKRLTRILGAAGQNGSISALQVLLTHFTESYPHHTPSKAIFEAAKHGKLDTVRWLVERYSDNAVVDVFRGISNQVNVTNTTNLFTVMDIAASHGHLEILRYLHEVDASQRNKRKRDDRDSYPNHNHYRRCTATAMNVAASNGYVEVIKWLHANRKEECTAYAMNSAAANGHLEVVEWLHLNRTEG